jgi:hypothetical protein
VVSNRGTAPPPPRGRPWVIDDLLVRARVRSAGSLQPTTLRLEALAARSPACGPVSALHNSQLLSHAPVDIDDPEAAEPRWPSRTVLRAAVRRKNSPFVSRAPFEQGDETALTVADEGRLGATPWQISGGSATVSGAPAPGLRHYALLGEDDWDHVRITADVDPAGAAAGIAVAVAGPPRVQRALLALVDEAAGELQILARRGGLTQRLAATPLPAGTAPYALEVHAFDDLLRARVGETVVETPRGDLREGRLALVLDGPARCHALHVQGLEAYATQLSTSRFAGFDEHLGSWDGVVYASPGQAAAVSGLVAATGAELAPVMTPEADPQERQRLFDRWAAEAVIPISSTVEGVRLSAVADASGVHVLLLESPEPLPFSTDVTMSVTHRVVGLPGSPPAGVSRSLLRFAADLAFARDTVSGAVSQDVLPVVSQTRRLVHAVRSGPLGRTLYRHYDLSVRTDPGGAAHLTGDLVDVRPAPPLTQTFPPRPRRFPADHIGLFDGNGEILAPLLPLPVERD